jgi:hypothetical protein
MQSYTYLIKFLPTGQVYYGSRSKNVKLGLAPENDLMVKYFTSCQPLKRLIKKHGLTAFSWQIRRRFDTPQQAAVWEQKVLHRMKVLHDPKWFNQNVAGFIVPTAAGLKKISETHKGIPKSAEHKKKIADALRGKKKSAEHCANLSIGHKGLNSGDKHYLFGKHHTEEQKQKQRDKMKGKPSNLSEDGRKKLRELVSGDYNPGKNKSASTRLKMSENQRIGRLGKVFICKETKRKLVNTNELDYWLEQGWVKRRKLM